ncbi:MAG TPA: hypothetical protein VF657_19920 [Actinoplanes sp.]|jgi:hypothetical protein
MTYRVEYNGSDAEITTLDAAVEAAKHAILTDVGPVSGWTIEHDEAINDWFIQGVRNGELVGSTAVVTGPEPVMGADELPGAVRHDADRYQPHRAADPYDGGDQTVRSVSFAGISATEVFGKATTWLAGRADGIAISDVAWREAGNAHTPCQLRIYYRAG